MPQWARQARPTLLGFSAFVDAYVRLESAAALFNDDAPEPARALGAQLAARAAAGVGGEITAPWPEGDAWLAARLTHEIAAGGTSVQIANCLALLGAPALLALSDRSAAQMQVLNGSIQVAADGALRSVHDIAADERRAKARHWIFESAAGDLVGGAPVPRSTRVIVRLVDDAPENDPAFADLSVRLAPGCGAAALSSLVSTPDSELGETVLRVSTLARRWREAGLELIHIELADYGARTGMAERILAGLHGAATSVGMSLSEWKAIGGGVEFSAPALRDFAVRHELSRVCVHADDWALAVTRGDPAREQAALVAGCLMAAARAAEGRPVVPAAIADDATFSAAPPAGDLGAGWSAVGCPSPYLRRPKSTIGLGDTFLAGSLLVLGQPPATRFDMNDEGVFQ